MAQIRASQTLTPVNLLRLSSNADSLSAGHGCISRTSSSAFRYAPVFREEIARCVVFYHSWGMANELTVCSGTVKKYNQKVVYNMICRGT